MVIVVAVTPGAPVPGPVTPVVPEGTTAPPSGRPAPLVASRATVPAVDADDPVDPSESTPPVEVPPGAVSGPPSPSLRDPLLPVSSLAGTVVPHAAAQASAVTSSRARYGA